LGNPLLCSLAVENDDFVVPVPFEVTFDIMSASGSLACINISIPQDSALEGDHEFTVQLSTLSPDVVTIGSPANVEVVIADDESKCEWVAHIISAGSTFMYMYTGIFVNMIRRL